MCRGSPLPGRFRHSERVLVIAAPGQGAQTPGFLAPWAEIPAAAAVLASASEATGLDLVALGTTGDAETIRDTAVAQPLLVAAAVASATALGAPETLPVGLWAGHSVGEVAVAALCGSLSDRDAFTFVSLRGRGMAAAAASPATGMTAILGGDREEILATLDELGITPANDNGPGQIVAAGTLAQLQALNENPPAKARLIPLSVAGAFHTAHMAPAVPALEELAATLAVADPRQPVLSNADGGAVTSGSELVARLVGQVANPVRWDLCMSAMAEAGATGLLELAPGGTLTGIARRALKGVATFALKTPDQLDDARAFCAEHGGAS